MTNKKQKIVRQIGIVLALAALLIGGNAVRQKVKDKKEKAKQEQRTSAFSEYIFEDIQQAVEKNITQEDIEKFEEMYKRDPKLFDEYIAELATDSSRYAQNIIRDAAVINKFDKDKGKTITFEEAIKIIRDIKNPNESFDKLHSHYDEKSLNRNIAIQNDVSTRLATVRRAKQGSEK